MKENHFRIEIFGIYPTKDDIELELLEEYNDRRDDYEISLRWNDNFLNEEIDELAKNNIFIEFLGDPSDYEAQYFKYKDEILPALFYVINNKICPLGVPDIDEDGISWDFYSIDGDWPESIAGVEFSLSSGYNTFDEAVEDYKKILSHYGYKNFKSLPKKSKENKKKDGQASRKNEKEDIQIPKDLTEKLYELNNKASELHSESKFDEAIKNYSMVLELMPKSNEWGGGGIVYAIPEDIMNGVIMSEVYCERGKCHYAVNNYEQAINDFNNCIRESNGENVDATYNIGSIKFSQGELMQAMKYFNKVISLDNNYHSAYYMRATCHVSSDNPNRSYEKALSDVNKFLSFEPDDKAANQFKSGIEEIGKKNIESDGLKINIGANQQQKEKLLETFNQINDLMKINKEMGTVEGEVDDLERAIEKIDFAISIYNIEKPYGLGDRKFSLPHLYFMRVQCHLQLQVEDQLVEDLKQVIIISNGNYIPDEGLGSKLFYMIKEKLKL